MTSIAIAVVEHEGRFLIGRRPPGVALAGLWEFPGGKIDLGESPEHAAVRECMEEAGVLVEPINRYHDCVEHYDHGTVHLHFIACRLAQIGIQDRPPIAPFHWVPRRELANCEFPAGNAALLKILLSENLDALHSPG